MLFRMKKQEQTSKKYGLPVALSRAIKAALHTRPAS